MFLLCGKTFFIVTQLFTPNNSSSVSIHTYLVSLSVDCKELKLDGFLDTDFRIVGTNVDIEFVAETRPATDDVRAGDGRAGGNT